VSKNNPTVALNVTAKELALISQLTGHHNGRLGSLGDKLNAADKDMRVAVRESRRLSKQEKEKKNAVYQGTQEAQTP
jgi:hypothetical protein